jgi:transcriptional regulator with XRE-family HTH domain
MSTLTTMNVPQLIEGLIRKYGSGNAAARACGMPEGTFHKLHRGERPNPTLDTLRLLARGYELPVDEIVRRLGDGNGDVRTGT